MSKGEPNRGGGKLTAILVIAVVVQAVLLGSMYWEFTGLSHQVAGLQDTVALDRGQLQNQSQLQSQTQSLLNSLQVYVADLLNDTAIPNGGVFAITSAYATGSGPWNVTLTGLNLQRISVMVTQILVGGTAFTGTVPPYVLPLAFQPWTTFHISFILNPGPVGGYSAGESIPITLSTSSGSAYSTDVILPPSDLPTGEKLAVSTYPGPGPAPDLVISVTNSGQYAISVTQLQVDGIPVPNAFYSVDVGNALTGTGPWGIAPGATGTFTMYHGEVVGPAPCGMGFIDGMSYPVTLVTGTGSSYPATISWP